MESFSGNDDPLDLGQTDNEKIKYLKENFCMK